MKRTFISLLTIFCLSFSTKAQESSVEKSIFNVQSGFLGLWVNYEKKISSQIALRTEFGFDGQLWGGSIYTEDIYAFQPVITLEPRWYNLAKRQLKGKSTVDNTANYKGIVLNYRPNLFVISNLNDPVVIPDFFIAPSFGLRRRLFEILHFEVGIAIGWQSIFYSKAGLGDDSGELAAKAHLRIGYTF